MLPSWVIPGSAVLFCAACSLLQSPTENTHSIAEAAGFMPLDLPDARLRGFAKPKPPSSTGSSRVTVYIESDGAPWRLPDEPPADPTPLKPVVLRMAIGDPSPAVAYLGRPCQYLPATDLLRCDPRIWMQARFSDEAVSAMSAAIDKIKQDFGSTNVGLVGYSGGGVMAALLAARRNDVSCVVTIASALDIRLIGYISLQKSSQCSGSCVSRRKTSGVSVPRPPLWSRAASTNNQSGSSTMNTKILVTVFLAAIAGPVLAQTPTPTPTDQVRQDNGQIRRDQRDVNKDKRDINRDKAEINKDRQERNADQRKEDQAIKQGDTKDAQKFEKRREHEQREINKEKRDLNRDRADLHKDRQERAKDVNKRNKDAAKIH